MMKLRCRLSLALCLVYSANMVIAQTAPDSLKQGFENPPSAARPRVWWHWMNGNITQEGIKLDLEWMHRVGIAGFQNFDAQLDTPQVVEHRLAYMTPEWKQAFLYATKMADQLGLEEAIAGSPGWSETGGPWVPPSEAMKKYVWSETFVEGGKPFTGKLVHPPIETGVFQNLKAESGDGTFPQFYADSAVIAYRLPASDVTIDSLHPKITTSGGPINAALLTDGDLNKSVSLPRADMGQQAWIRYEFSKPQTIRGFTLVMAKQTFFEDVSERRSPDSGESLEASDDGKNFHVIATVPKIGSRAHTMSFDPVTAKYFRVTFKMLPTPPAAAFHGPVPPAPTDVRIAELVLHPGARVNSYEEKAGFTWQRSQVPDLYSITTPSYAAPDAIQKTDIVDLTSKMSADGTLDWTPPPGRWEVLRFGYSLMGVTNHPASKEATGPEVDKLNSTYVKHYMDNYLKSYESAVGPELMGARGIKYVITDSWEAGSQNWTDNMLAEFTKRRGYDPRPWMPVLAGRVVQSAEASDKFLWDFRKTIADLIADEHYGQVNASLQARGMGQYGESHEGGRAFIGDGMEVKKFDQIPMSAMWTQTPGVNRDIFGYDADDRESASVAHIYGRSFVAAESMTAAAAPWAWSPSTLKPTADQELLNGINRFVIHCSVHQPLIDKAPGLTLGIYGQWFTRNETWAEQAGPWIDYLARSSYMLQQGHFHADLLYFYGEDSNLTSIFLSKAPDVPAGYGFDYINADALIHQLSVRNNVITTESGMGYRLLGLDPYSRHMSLPVLRAIHALVERGGIVAGPKPLDDPSLADDQAEFKKLSDELFGDGTGIHTVGKGKVYAGQKLDDVFQAMHVAPDFDYHKPKDSPVRFVHRELPGADIYFVDSRSDNATDVDASFRITGRTPELWRAETGKTEPVSYKIKDGRTFVPLHMDPWEAVFVVFRKPAKATMQTLAEPVETKLLTVSEDWNLAFQPDKGAPSSIAMGNLTSWSESKNDGVKYFSGTGTYTKILDAPAAWFKTGTQLMLNLGEVKNLAEVIVNGKSLGIVWHAPYRVDVSEVLKPGKNQIEIKVTNAWVNRLIGDEQPGTSRKYTFTPFHPYDGNSPLLPSGLLGPVQITSVTKP